MDWKYDCHRLIRSSDSPSESKSSGESSCQDLRRKMRLCVFLEKMTMLKCYRKKEDNCTLFTILLLCEIVWVSFKNRASKIDSSTNLMCLKL